MINSKNKGKTYELEIAKELKKYGYETRRSVQYNGKAEAGMPDVVGLPGIHIECKRTEKLNIDEALEQAVRDHKQGTIPTVWHRKNSKRTKVTMYMEDFMRIYEVWKNEKKK